MAFKKKDEDKNQKSKLLEILTRDYKWENLLLGVLAIAAAVVSVLIINKTLTIDKAFPVLGKGNNAIIFASFLLVISLVGLILVLIPFFIPAWPELKKISWPSWAKFLENTIQTFIFVVVLALSFLLFDYIVVSVIERIHAVK